MIGYLKYFFTVLKHKYFVIVAGRKLGLGYIQLVLHDISKFLPVEFIAYKRRFIDKDNTALGVMEFDYAWNHHQKNNKHHWQYWVVDLDNFLLIPVKHLKEMAADYFAAARAYNGAWPSSYISWVWYSQHFHNVKMLSQSKEQLVVYLDKLMLSFNNNIKKFKIRD